MLKKILNFKSEFLLVFGTCRNYYTQTVLAKQLLRFVDATLIFSSIYLVKRKFLFVSN